MAGAGVTIEIQDIGVSAALDQLLRAAGDFTPAMASLGEHLLRSHHERWDREIAPDGTPWAPLSPGYAARKAQAHPAAGILEASGMLRRLNYQAGRDSLTLGTNRIYGATHQYGDDERGIPARPYLGFEPGDLREAAEILIDFLSPRS